MTPWKEDQAEFEEDVRVCYCERGFDEGQGEVAGKLTSEGSNTQKREHRRDGKTLKVERDSRSSQRNPAQQLLQTFQIERPSG